MAKKNNLFLVLVIAAVVIGVYFYYSGGVTQGISNLQNLGYNRGNNGYWHTETQECWSTPNSLSGGKLASGACCFDQQGYQVDCKDATKRLNNVQQLFAIYQGDYPGGTSTPGIFAVAPFITISNTGSTPLDRVWIQSATWTANPSNPTGVTNLQANWSRTVGQYSTYANLSAVSGLPVGTGSQTFPANLISLQSLDTGTGTVYNVTVVSNATSYNGNISSSSTNVFSFKVTKESIGLGVTITWQ